MPRSLAVTRRPRARRFITAGGALLLTILAAACADEPSAPATPPDTPPVAHGGHVLGLVEVTLSGIGSGDMHASARAVPRFGTSAPAAPSTTARGLHPSLTTLPGTDGSIELDPLSTGSFTNGVPGSGGERYMYATFRVRNAQADSTPYTDARTNLTFLAVSTASTIDQSAISTMKRFDGSAANPAIATQIVPTGAAHRTLDGTIAPEGPDVLQLPSETEASAIDLTNQPAVTSVFPYGFVVRNPSTPASRTLPASPAAGQFDGVVTFAFKVPLQASAADDPFSVSAMFLAVDDDETRLTQSLEEQSAGNDVIEAKVAQLGATQLTLLPQSTALQGAAAVRVVCDVRLAGPNGSPTATFTAPTTGEPWLLQNPWRPGPYMLPRTAQLAAARCPSITSADSSTFTVHGFQSGRPSGAYTGVGTTIVRAPAASGSGFFPGEEVEVTLTPALGGNVPQVARYRAATTAGSGTFAAAADTLTTGASPTSIAAGDLDRDGDIDLVVVNQGDNDIFVFHNDGAATFSTVDTIGVAAEPQSVIAADLDGDGDLDLAVTLVGNDTVLILQNDGAGAFSSLGTPTAFGARAIVASDLDGDGDLDLAVANYAGNTITILQNDGAGGFTTLETPATVAANPNSIAAADLDGDGDIDLAVAPDTFGNCTILRNDGTGHFSSTSLTVGFPFSVAAADLDGDGDVDLAVTSNVNSTGVTLLNDGAGNFTSGTGFFADAPQSLTAADLDADGDLDLAVAISSFNTISILRNDGRGSFTPAGVGTRANRPSVVAADLDGDGDIDLAATDLSAKTVLLFTNQ